MSITRILCQTCGFPLVYCQCNCTTLKPMPTVQAAHTVASPQPARCPHCGYTPGVIPSDFDAYAQANCEHREGHGEPAPAPRTPEDSNTNGSNGVSGGNPRTPAPLPEADETICARLLFACNGHPHALIPWPHRLLHDAVAHISAQARRLAEVEAERDSIKCEVAAVREIRWSDEVKNFKLLRRERESVSYLNRIIRASLSGGHAALELLETERDKERHRRESAEARVRELEAEEEERKAGWQLAGDAARGLRVECDGDLGHEAEQIRAERDDLQAFKSRVMEWARGRCECCGHSNAAGQGIPHVSKVCRECCNSEGTPNWTPPQAWEAGE